MSEPMVACGRHTLAEADTAAHWDGLCPICLSDSLTALRKVADQRKHKQKIARAGQQAMGQELAKVKAELAALQKDYEEKAGFFNRTYKLLDEKEAELRGALKGHWDHDDKWCFSCHQALDECEARQLIEERLDGPSA